MDLSSIAIVGYEGVWGACIMFAIFLPVAYFLPGAEGNAVHENTLDTFYMIGHSIPLEFIIALSLISSFGYNLMGMIVTGLICIIYIFCIDNIIRVVSGKRNWTDY